MKANKLYILCSQSLVVLGSLLVIGNSARYLSDSAITTISLPYDRYGRAAYNEPMNLIDLNLNAKEDFKVLKMQGAREVKVNIADGAYPVYYTPSYVNGQFNGKMYLLKY